MREKRCAVLSLGAPSESGDSPPGANRNARDARAISPLIVVSVAPPVNDVDPKREPVVPRTAFADAVLLIWPSLPTIALGVVARLNSNRPLLLPKSGFVDDVVFSGCNCPNPGFGVGLPPNTSPLAGLVEHFLNGKDAVRCGQFSEALDLSDDIDGNPARFA